MPNPYTWLIGVLVALAASTALFVGGCVHGESMSDGKQAKTTVKAAQADANRITVVQNVSSTVAEASAAEHVRVITKFQPIDREVIRYVQTHDAAAVCLDDDGLRIWRAANRGEFEAPQPASAGHDSLPVATGASEWIAERPPGQPRGSDEAIPPVHGAPGGTGELDRADKSSPGAANE
ncbi:MAG: hypothetical protein JWL63_3222 [Rhodocyclales bacterium]|nr:hypothetical protein [Rhodocyclales bacterium]